MPTPCQSCPFAMTQESEYGQNTGCLPSAYDVVQLKKNTGHNWACHSNCNRVCQGLVEDNTRRNLGLDLQDGLLIHDFEAVHDVAQYRGPAEVTIDYLRLRKESVLPLPIF